jgi:uncharacterized protein YtpQ (UPF0354 family)
MTINKAILTMGLFGSIFGLESCSDKKLDTSKIFPYIITEHYLIDGTIVVDSLGHGLYTTMVYDLNGVVQNVRQEELEKNNLTNKEVFDKSLQNLDSVLKARQININRFDGPGGTPFILVSDHWLSAATLLATNIHTLAKSGLGTDTIYASIPHRDVLILFPKCIGGQLDSFKQMIKDKESDGRKPLTFDLFQLDNTGLKVVE